MISCAPLLSYEERAEFIARIDRHLAQPDTAHLTHLARSNGYQQGLLDAQPGAQRLDKLVTMVITIDRQNNAESDVQTHDNSFAEVYAGLMEVRREIERVMDERHKCPHFPKTKDDANKKIIRAATPSLTDQPETPKSFSEFIKNASPEEKAQVYEEVMVKASERMNGQLEAAKCPFCDLPEFAGTDCKRVEGCPRAGRVQPEAAPVAREKVIQAIARGWCAPLNAHKETDTSLAESICDEIMELLASPPSAPDQECIVENAHIPNGWVKRIDMIYFCKCKGFLGIRHSDAGLYWKCSQCDFSEFVEMPSTLRSSASSAPDRALVEDQVAIPAKALLAIRDAIVIGNTDEAFHQLYFAVPWKDPFEPWAEWERILAALESKP